MPELPEVQTVVDELDTSLKGKRINHIEVLSQRLIRDADLDINDCLHLEILNVERRGKYIRLNLSNNFILIAHLRMTGKFVTSPDERDQNYIRAIIHLDGYEPYYFVDVRQFGTFYFTKNEDYLEQKLGPEPLGTKFTDAYLINVCQKSQRTIKSLIMDQAIVTGVGNIYADESLFLSKIKPNKPASSVSRPKIRKLVENIKFVLNQAIKNMGTTLSDYRNTENMAGENQNYLFVYGMEGQECKRCQSIIKRIKIAGRSSHYCPKCQK